MFKIKTVEFGAILVQFQNQAFQNPFNKGKNVRLRLFPLNCSWWL